MKKFMMSLLLAVPLWGFAEAVPGKVAPAFEVQDASGKMQKLSDHKGKWVVLEWFNKDCPYVKKHYGSGNMQKLQQTYTAKGVVWLSVLSSAEGKQGFLNAEAAQKEMKTSKSAATAMLLDAKGEVGKAYGAKTTPHMFVISPKGDVVYAGAIDDNDSADASVIAQSKNYVQAALDSSLANKPVVTTNARPYGCSVKYK